MTVFIQVIPGKPQVPPADDWKPWINATGRDEIVKMAALQHIRLRGGIERSEEPYEFTVYSYTDKCEKYPSGKPKTALAELFHGTKV